MNATILRYASHRGRTTLRAGALWLFAALFIVAAGDDIERRFAPILADQLATPIARGETPDGVLCWQYRAMKRREATPVEAAWTVVDDLGNRFAVVPTTNEGIPPRIVNAPAGFTFDRKFCASVPPEIAFSRGRVEVDGFITYRTRWTPWLVRQDFPPVVWLPVRN